MLQHALAVSFAFAKCDEFEKFKSQNALFSDFNIPTINASMYGIFKTTHCKSDTASESESKGMYGKITCVKYPTR